MPNLQLEDRDIPSKQLRFEFSELGKSALEIVSQIHFPPGLNDPNRLTRFQRDGSQQCGQPGNEIPGGEYVEVGTGREDPVSAALKLFQASNRRGKRNRLLRAKVVPERETRLIVNEDQV